MLKALRKATGNQKHIKCNDQQIKKQQSSSSVLRALYLHVYQVIESTTTASLQMQITSRIKITLFSTA